MKKQVKKIMHLFFKGAYAIAYREAKDNEFHFDKLPEYHVIEPTLHKWYADPFPFVSGENRYIFVEIMDDKNGKKGTIGVINLNSNEGFVEIINEPFHMSFPNVFKYKDDIYMIPETSEARQLRLYKAVDFPYKWKLEAILVENIQIVDTVLMFTDNRILAVGQCIPQKVNAFFEIDFEHLTAHRIKVSGNYIDKRPAGNFIEFSDGIYHALQECGRVYGEYLHVCKIQKFDRNLLIEKKVAEYSVNDMVLDSSKKFRRVHTYNRMDNLEVVDLLYYQINPTIIIEAITSYMKKVTKIGDKYV